ncbi:polysaccharide deacetylase family protein [Clostridium psychrophilum]|uniref:polysaccharide deacetylase family protein n=1 Tax=Clostridium psychrophilum TaxID=132926 RepID=UPI001C0C8EB9|nr:polysaccharide deacetylase family protein [Clostridium psychrophilum]MBU3180179.1 polysaccharide deacetylase family protein [Clostridium psychrophilum]
MKKKLSFIFTFIFLLFTFGCSRTKTITKEKAKPVMTSVENSSIPGFKSTTVIKHYGRSIPVLSYHSINYDKNNPICISVEKFKEQMKYLKNNGYYTITLTNLYGYLMNNIPIPKKSVVITFDDGYENNYTAMFPVLKKYNFRATIFVITSFIDKNHTFMTSKQLLEMDKYGVDIESHTVHHDNLAMISNNKQLKTLIQSKQYLEKILNKPINFFAYPYGGYNKSAIEALKKAGYKMAFTTEGGWSSKHNGVFSLHRVWVGHLDSMKVFKNKISEPDYQLIDQL